MELPNRGAHEDTGILSDSATLLEPPSGMALDTHVSLGQLFPNSADVKPAITAIAACVQDREESRRWASNLKLLTADIEVTPHDDDEDLIGAWIELLAEEQPELIDTLSVHVHCSCIGHKSAPLYPRQKSLMLTDATDVPDCSQYVAVSYSWDSMKQSTYTGPPFRVRTRDGVRAPRCPPALLERVISYTWDKNYRYFWIDQECIDQNSADDVEVGMQAMDLVYQNSNDCVAVLKTTITQQRHCDAIACLVNFDPSTAAPDHATDVLEALEIITSDPWFERAWTLQESTSGGDSMTLLVPCDADIEIPSGVSQHTYEWIHIGNHMELGLNDMMVSLVTWFEPNFPGYVEGRHPAMAVRLRSWQDNWLRLFPTGVLDFRAEGHSNVSNASEALWHMAIRKNSVVADRLAIMANLCGFEQRLDTTKLSCLGYGFSICAFVLSLLNGDTSLLTGVEACYQGGRCKTSSYSSSHVRGDMPHHGHSLALPSDVCLDDVPAREKDSDGTLLDLFRASWLSDGSFLTEGCIWVVDHAVDLAPVRAWLLEERSLSEIREHLNGKPADFTRFFRFRVDFLVYLLCHLSARQYKGMVQLLWRSLRDGASRLSRSNPQEFDDYAQADFEEVVDVPSRSIRWPQPAGFQSPSSLLLQRYNVSGEPFTSLPYTAISHLIRCTMDGARLCVARPVASEPVVQSYSAFLENAELGEQFFTPRVNIHNDTGEYGLSSSPLETSYSWYLLAWRVSGKLREGADRKRLQCSALHRGVWLADESNGSEVELV